MSDEFINNLYERVIDGLNAKLSLTLIRLKRAEDSAIVSPIHCGGCHECKGMTKKEWNRMNRIKNKLKVQ